MAETLAAMFASSATATSTAAATTAATTTAAAATTTAATTAFSWASAAEWLSYGLTAVSALSSIGAGKQQALALKEQQMQSDLQAQQALLQGRRESLETLIALNETMARNQVAGATSGLVTSEGSVREAQEGAKRKAEFENSMARENAEIIAGSRRSQSRQYGLEAKAATRAGYGKAAGLLAEAGMRYARRG